MGVECLCGGGEGDVGLVALLAQVGAVGHGWGVGEESVDLSGYVAFEAADDLAAGFAFGAAPCGVVAAALVAGESHGGDAPEGVVGVAVAAAVQSVSHGGPRGRLDGAGAAERGEGGFAAHATGVVAGGDEQRGGDGGADAGRGQ